MVTQSRCQRIAALMNQKGGVGKTTTAVNLGAALADQQADVLMIDLDPQAHLTLHLGLEPTDLDGTVYDLLLDDQTTPEAIARRVEPRLTVLPSEVDLAGAETELAERPDRQMILKRRIGSYVQQFDYVLIDCPPSLGLLTINALALAREVIVPMQAHFLALQGLSKLLETVQLVRKQVNPTLRVAGIVLCLHDGHTKLAGEVVSDLEKFFQASRPLAMPWSGASIYSPPIRRNIKLAECPSFGQTIFRYASWCAGAHDYRQLARAIMAEDGRAPGSDTTSAAPNASEDEADSADDAEAPPSIHVADPALPRQAVGASDESPEPAGPTA